MFYSESCLFLLDQMQPPRICHGHAQIKNVLFAELFVGENGTESEVAAHSKWTLTPKFAGAAHGIARISVMMEPNLM